MVSLPDLTDLDGLDIAIDRRAEVPIGVQLAWALRARIRDGRLAPQQRLPGLRDLADALGINPNTVRAVYQRLAQQQLIDTQQGSGTFVAATPPQPSAVDNIAARAAREADRHGVDPREVAAALYVVPQPSLDPASASIRRRRQLRQQIAALEQMLTEIESAHPGILPPPAARGRARPTGPRLLEVDELEHAQGRLLRRLAAAQAAVDEHAQPAGSPKQTTAPTRTRRASRRTRPAPAGA